MRQPGAVLTSFSVTVSIRLERPDDELPRPRVALVPAPWRPLLRDRDRRDVVDEPYFALSLGLASPLTAQQEDITYPVFDTSSQRISLGDTVVLLDSALGSAPCRPRPARLRDEQDWGMQIPFDGWWVWPDFADDFTEEMEVTVLSSVRWAGREGREGREHQEGVLVDLTMAALDPDR